MLTGHAGLQAHKLSGSGDFLHVNGKIERFQVAVPTAADFEKLPRGEVAWPTIEEEDTPRALNFPKQSETGRPLDAIDFHLLGKIVGIAATSEKIVPATLASKLGIYKGKLERYLEAASETLEGLKSEGFHVCSETMKQ